MLTKKWFKKRCQQDVPKIILAKAKRYKKLACAEFDSFGWLKADQDHSLEFSSLFDVSCGGGIIDITAAEVGGRFYRHPSKVKKSLEDLKDRSSISRDMFIGAMWWIWVNKRLDVIERTIKYANSHFWKMGNFVTTPHLTSQENIKEFLSKFLPSFLIKVLQPLIVWLSRFEGVTRVFLSPGLMATFCELRFRLGGKNSVLRFIPQLQFRGNKGFRANLTVLHIGFRGEIRGYVTDRDLKILKWYAHDQPSNALFQATYHKYKDGNQSKVFNILMREDLFPSEGLPTSKNRATYYLWSSPDTSLDWMPDSGPEIMHSGVDYLWTCYYIKEK